MAPEVDDTFVGYDHNNLFYNCCLRGRLDVMKWLSEMSCHEIVVNYKLFARACRNGHLEVAKWLLNLSLQSGQLIKYHLSRSRIQRMM